MSDDRQTEQRHSVSPARGNQAVLYCLIVTAIAAAGGILGFIIKSPLIIALFLLPTAVYELVRTQGVTTKAASLLLTAILAAELIVILFRIDFNLAKIAGIAPIAIGGYRLPLGDIRIIGAGIMAVLSILLFVRTAGIYTKWLSVVLFVACFAFIYTTAPAEFAELWDWASREIGRLFRR